MVALGSGIATGWCKALPLQKIGAGPKVCSPDERPRDAEAASLRPNPHFEIPWPQVEQRVSPQGGYKPGLLRI